MAPELRLHDRSLLMPEDDDDSTLCRKAAAGCEPSFVALFQRYYDAVHGLVYRLSWNAADAEDVAQETFIKAARSLGQFGGRSSFKNWLYSIAMNTLRDKRRSAAREEKTREAIVREMQEAREISPGGREAVAELLAALPADLRDAVTLVYIEGLNHREAALVLGCAETTVSWRVFRAKGLLRRHAHDTGVLK